MALTCVSDHYQQIGEGQCFQVWPALGSREAVVALALLVPWLPPCHYLSGFTAKWSSITLPFFWCGQGCSHLNSPPLSDFSQVIEKAVMSIGSTNLASQFSKSSDTTIQWTELLVGRDPPSASAAFFAIFLLSFAHIASLLASLLYSVVDKAPLSSAVVRCGVIPLSAQKVV